MPVNSRLSRFKKIKFKKHVPALAVFAGLIAAGLYVFLNLGSWLLLDDPLPAEGLDVIVTFAEEPERVRHSRELFDRCPGAHWIISFRDSAMVGRYLPRPPDTSRVTMVDTCTRTLTEIRFVKQWLHKNRDRCSRGGRRPVIGFVSCPYHQLRIHWLALKSGLGFSNRLVHLPVPLAWYGWDREYYKKWWKNRQARTLVTGEYLKMLVD